MSTIAANTTHRKRQSTPTDCMMHGRATLTKQGGGVGWMRVGVERGRREGVGVGWGVGWGGVEGD